MSSSSLQLQYPANTLVVAGAAALGVALVGSYLLKNQQKGNGASSTSSLAKTHKLPPLVPFSQPGMDHTIEYYTNPEGFLKACQEKHGDTFRLMLRGRFLTVVTLRDDVNAVFNETDKMSFPQGVRTMAPILKMIANEDLNDSIHKNISLKLTPKLRVYTPRLIKNLQLELETQLNQPHINPERIEIPYPIMFFNFVVAKASASVLLGEELCKDQQVLSTCAMLAFDIGTEMNAQMGAKKLHPWLAYFVDNYRFMTGSVAKHTSILRKALTPVVRKRYDELLISRKTGHEFERAADVLQDMIEDSILVNSSFSAVLEDVVIRTRGLIFASIHTTSTFSSRTLYYLLTYPQYLEEIKEEQREIFANAQEGVELLYDNETSTKKMKKLDSFVREVLRLTVAGIQIEHLVTEDTELANGFYVPKDDLISANFSFVHRADADRANFDPWRHLESGKQAIKVGTDFLSFGLGPHACPGRFFAVQEVKSIVALILRRFDISTDSEGVKAPHSFAVPGADFSGKIILTPRKD